MTELKNKISVTKYSNLKQSELINSLDEFAIVQIELSNKRVEICEKLFALYREMSSSSNFKFFSAIMLASKVVLFHSGLWELFSFYRQRGSQCKSFIKRGDSSSVITFKK